MARQFGDILVDAGLLDHDQLDGYSARAASVSSHLGLLLIGDNLCTDREIAEAIGLHSEYPPVQLSQLRIPGYIATLLPMDLAERLAAIPVSVKQENGLDVLYVAFFDPTDTAAVEEVRKATNKRVKPVVASLGDIRAAIQRSFSPAKKRRTMELRAADPGIVSSGASSGRIPAVAPLPPLPPPAEELDAETPWLDEGLALPEAELEEFDAPAPAETSPAPAASPTPPAAADFDLGDMGFDLDFGDPVAPDGAPAGKNDPFQVEDNSVGETDRSLDFLSFSDSRLGEHDEEILRKQREAEKVRADLSFGVDHDLDFALETPQTPAPSPDPGDSDLGLDDAVGDLTFDEPDVSRDEFIESWEDDNFDLGSTSGAHPIPSPTATRDPEPPVSHVADAEEDFDEFDFDIPAAPDFEPGSSGSFPIPSPTRTETPVSAPDPAPSAHSEDWSLDVDSLFDQMNGELEGAEVAPPPDAIDFETASRELDRLLASGGGIDFDAAERGDQGDLALELARLVTEISDPDPEDVDLMDRLIRGQSDPGDFGRLRDLSRTVGGVARKLIDSGLVAEVGILDQLLQAEHEA